MLSRRDGEQSADARGHRAVHLAHAASVVRVRWAHRSWRGARSSRGTTGSPKKKARLERTSSLEAAMVRGAGSEAALVCASFCMSLPKLLETRGQLLTVNS